MNNTFERITKNIGKEVIFGNDIELYLDELGYGGIELNIKGGIKLFIKKYSRLYGEDEQDIRHITFCNQDGSLKFEFEDQFITFDKSDMTQEILDEGMMLYLIDEENEDKSILKDEYTFKDKPKFKYINLSLKK